MVALDLGDSNVKNRGRARGRRLGAVVVAAAGAVFGGLDPSGALVADLLDQVAELRDDVERGVHAGPQATCGDASTACTTAAAFSNQARTGFEPARTCSTIFTFSMSDPLWKQ